MKALFLLLVLASPLANASITYLGGYNYLPALVCGEDHVHAAMPSLRTAISEFQSEVSSLKKLQGLTDASVTISHLSTGETNGNSDHAVHVCALVSKN